MSTWLLLLACRATPIDSQDSDGDTAETADTAPDVVWDAKWDALQLALEQDLAANTAYGASAAVWVDGELVWTGVVGSAASGHDLDPDTLFAIGSTTKQLTAAHLLQRVDAGDVALDDTLDAVLPDLDFVKSPGVTAEITVEHLLTHQGAFYDYLAWQASAHDDALASTAYGAFTRDAYVMAEPGAFWNYSNPNFSLAGLIAEETGDGAWADLIHAELLAPLGMDACSARGEVVEQGAWARGIFPQQALDIDPTTFEPAWARPAGLVWCRPTDMVRWAEFLLDGDPDVLSDDLREQITAKHVDTLSYNDLIHYGYGLFIQDGFYDGRGWVDVPVWSHGGNTLGHTSMFWVLPEQRVAVSILSSGYGTDFSASMITAVGLAADLPDAVDLPRRDWDPTQLDHLTGRYMDPNNVGEMLISREGDGLFVDMPLLDELGMGYRRQLTPAGTDLWLVTIDGADYDLTFVRDGHQADRQWIRNRIFVATRADLNVAGDAAPAAVTKPTLTPTLPLPELMLP